MKRFSQILCYLGFGILALSPLIAQEPENKTASVEILKTTYGDQWLRIVVLNNSDEAIREFIVTIENGTVRKRFWPVTGTPLAPHQSRVLEYRSQTQPKQVSLDGVVFVDGYGEGIPEKLRESQLWDEAYLEGLNSAIELLEDLRARLKKDRDYASESLEMLSKAGETLKARLRRPESIKTGDEMWKVSGREAGLQAAFRSVQASRDSIQRLCDDPLASLAQPENAAALARRVGDEVSEIVGQLSLIKSALRR